MAISVTDLIVPIATAIVLFGGAMAVLRKWLKPVETASQVFRLIVGEELPNRRRQPGILDDVAELKEFAEGAKPLLQHLVAETSPNHGSSMKDALNSLVREVKDLRLMVEENQEIRERQHAEGLESDARQDEILAEQSARLEDIRKDVAGMSERGTAAVMEIQRQTSTLEGRLEEHTRNCKCDDG